MGSTKEPQSDGIGAIEPGDCVIASERPPQLERSEERGSCFTPMAAITAISLVLLVSLVILGPKIAAWPQGRLTACASNLADISLALEIYSIDAGGKYPMSITQLTPNYLRALPKCPSADSGSYRAHFGLNAPFNLAPGGQEPDYYYVECAGENHTSVGITGNFPAYSGVQGLIERGP